ncbi:MFS family permease [Mycetocola sp. BIGb0189]|uniref:MFS transporter n=1 Tax=Mycetocola sp. BIGb0189 TaxID=2940604 RepID=UPI0021692FB0|nr:MFS transporter [Mycetocola sp. BIGb0189]MCS4275829.1 MFS family permease [Mycetocola sp. BIGb0189]
MQPQVSDTPSTATKPQIPLVLSAVFLVYLGQMTLNPIIAPLSREVGLAEWQVGVMISLAAVCVVLSSQFWGRASLSRGRKPVLVAAMGTAVGAMALFALLAQLGMQGTLRGTALFILLLITRGLLFGLAIAAVPPTAQAYIADVTTTTESRVRGMAGVGAVQGLAMIGGAVVGGALAGFGLMVPLLCVPVMIGIGLIAVMLFLRREQRHELIENPPKVSPWDPRAWPFLLAGFGLFTGLGFVQIITGFIVQDRFALNAGAAAGITGAALLAAGAGMVIAQAVLVPRLGWRPGTLLRVGAAVSLAGFLVLIPNAGIPPLVIALFLIGLGLGLAMPGYTAGPSLLMRAEEQGGIAGLIAANNALTFVLTPTLATLFYTWWPPLPLIVSALVCSAVLVFVLTHPRFRATV